jgi:hypothetical protein
MCFGLVVGALLAKNAVGHLAAGMYAGDFAITDGAPSTDDREGGRYIIWRIASAVDPYLLVFTQIAVFALLLVVISHGAIKLAQLVLSDNEAANAGDTNSAARAK